ncbi:TadE/TadG family type IV pilus assembly protein [Kordiimonas pumila]|uniref:TadE/TadG family type IV pilus assembly protein n=1 Tax=Kordiimonas pumila TaxID=2161677 RepID=A0ABV7D6K8_9PROT|nr:TadE family protein [Kordiimonas pumila]
MGWFNRKLHRIKRNEQGSVLIETALGLPILLITIIGVLEVANMLFVSIAVENAVLRASRFGITGSNGEAVSRIDQVRTIIEENTFGRVNMDTVDIQTLVYDQFSDIGEPEPYEDDNDSGTWDEGEAYTDVNGNGAWDADMGTEGLGGAGDIVLYRINYAANSLSGLTDWAGKSVNVSSTVAVRNEPY